MNKTASCSFIHLFIPLFNKYLLSIYYKWDTVTLFFQYLSLFLHVRAVTVSQQNWGEGIEITHAPHCPHTCIASPLSTPAWYICYNWISYMDPWLSPKVHSLHLVYSWWCMFHGFGQICNDMYPSFWYHAKYFHRPKDPLYSA